MVCRLFKNIILFEQMNERETAYAAGLNVNIREENERE
jgi:hypothetical protein